LILAASHADAAPTEEKDDLVAPQKQFVPAQFSAADALIIEGFPQPQLVATHEIAPSYNPAPGLVQRTFQLRPRIQNKSKVSLAKMAVRTIVSPVPRPKSPIYGRYRHTATSDPYVDAHN
jgi:hypothetical protein